MQMLLRNAMTKTMRSQQGMLLANRLPVQYFPWKRSWQYRSWECSSSSGFQCINPCEASVSQNHKGSSLHLFLVVTAEVGFLGEARQERRCLWSTVHLQSCWAGCLPVQVTRASQESFQVRLGVLSGQPTAMLIGGVDDFESSNVQYSARALKRECCLL
jgi:hypothetical protein